MIILTPNFQKLFHVVSKDQEEFVKFSKFFMSIPLFVGWVVLVLSVSEGVKLGSDGNPVQVK
jgi:hypothetical protein